MIFFCGQPVANKTSLGQKKREVALQIKQKGNRRLRLVEACSLEFLQNYCPSNTRHFL